MKLLRTDRVNASLSWGGLDVKFKVCVGRVDVKSSAEGNLELSSSKGSQDRLSAYKSIQIRIEQLRVLTAVGNRRVSPCFSAAGR